MPGGWGPGQARTGTTAWKKLRLTILERDGHTCQLAYPDRCIGRATEVDHIDAVHLGGTDEVNGLRAACSPCHAKRSSEQGNAARPRERRDPEPHPGLRAAADADSASPGGRHPT